MIPRINTRNAFADCFAALVAVVLCAGFCGSAEVDAGKCLVWGPGLSPAAVLPVRYFYIQSVDSQGRNISVASGENVHLILRIHLLEGKYQSGRLKIIIIKYQSEDLEQ